MNGRKSKRILVFWAGRVREHSGSMMGNPPSDFDPRRWRLAASVAVPVFLAYSAVAIGLRPEHWVVSALYLGCFWVGPRSAWFAYLALPFLGVGIAYDSFRLLLDLRGEIHVADLYHAELAWFGVNTASGRVTLPELFERHTWAIADAICGFAYIVYLFESFAFAAMLFFKDQDRLRRFAWGFLLLNLLGLATWILWPAAPPWYVEQYGLGPAVLDAKASAAGAARFDALISAGVFASFYSRSANVFGAMPSLHVGYPVLVACAAWTMGLRWAIPAITFSVLVAFSAVYLQHHYVLDVIAGCAYALTTYAVMIGLAQWRGTAHATQRPEEQRGARKWTTY